MKTTFKTSLFADALSKVSKCASCNKMLPLTTMIEISVLGNAVCLHTTDGTNDMGVTFTAETNENFYVVADITVLSKLVAKTTSDKITLTVENDSLLVKGNGRYSIELPLDEDGKLVSFPSKVYGTTKCEFTIATKTLKHILKTNKPALSDSLSAPCYTGYYLGDSVITTDGVKICCTDYKLVDEPILVNADMFALVDCLTDAECTIILSESNEISIRTESIFIDGKLMDCIDEFAIAKLMPLINSELPYSATVNRQSVLNALDRLSLFVNPFDRDAIAMSFGADALVLTNLKANSSETIECGEVENAYYNISILLLKSQISALSGETIEIQYGNDRFIKMVDGDTTQVLALLGE